MMNIFLNFILFYDNEGIDNLYVNNIIHDLLVLLNSYVRIFYGRDYGDVMEHLCLRYIFFNFLDPFFIIINIKYKYINIIS